MPAPVEPPELDNIKCRFEPEVQVVHHGNIDIVNKDPVLHNTRGYCGKRTAFNTALPNQKEHVTAELPKTGRVRVDCDAHGWMEGWSYVRDNPYYATTGPDGKFSITDMPTSWTALEKWGGICSVGCQLSELGRAYEVECGMAVYGAAEAVEISGNRLLSLAAGIEDCSPWRCHGS